jgi:hypothetical protein
MTIRVKGATRETDAKEKRSRGKGTKADADGVGPAAL